MKITQISRIETYPLFLNGHYVRKATKAILVDGSEIKFTEKMTNKEVVSNVNYQLERRGN